MFEPNTSPYYRIKTVESILPYLIFNFRKYIQVVPLGNAHVEFTKSGNKFSWRKVTTTVHNIIVGK